MSWVVYVSPMLALLYFSWTRFHHGQIQSEIGLYTVHQVRKMTRWLISSSIFVNILHNIISMILYIYYVHMFHLFILDNLYHILSYSTILNYIIIYCICMCALCVLYLHAHTTCTNRLQIKRIVIVRIVKESILWGQQMDSVSHCDSTRQQWPKPIGEGK